MQKFYVSGPCPSSGIQNARKQNVFDMDVSIFR
jgi:hypothetical protein